MIFHEKAILWNKLLKLTEVSLA